MDERVVLRHRNDLLLEELHRLYEMLDEVRVVCDEHITRTDNHCAYDVLYVLEHGREAESCAGVSTTSR